MIKTLEGNTLPIRRISSYEIFNLPLFEDYFVVDTRRREEYEQDHIVTAVCFPPTIMEHIELEIYKLLRDIVLFGSPSEHLDKMIFYGDENSQDHLNNLVERVKTIKIKPIPLKKFQKENGEEELEILPSFYARWQNHLKQIWILDETFQQFRDTFPLLCISVNKEATPLPCCIAPGLYLGSRSISFERRQDNRLCIDRNTLAQLKITHAVVSSNTPLDVEDSSGITCLRCQIEDKDDQDMSPYWNYATEFIENARKTGGNVIIQVYGRSRSSSFAIFWTMKIMKLSFEEALSFVKERCFYSLDVKCMFLDQLERV